MTANGRRKAKWGGIAAGMLAVGVSIYGMRSPLQGTGRNLLDVPSRHEVAKEIADSLAAHVRLQALQLDSIKRQTDAIRCVIDGDYAERHENACKWGLQ